LVEAVKRELGRRGKTFVDARPVLHDLEQEVERRISDDPRIDHDAAGRLSDHLMDAAEAVRAKFNLGDGRDA